MCCNMLQFQRFLLFKSIYLLIVKYPNFFFKIQEIKDGILKRKEILKNEMKEWRKETRIGKCTEVNENINTTISSITNVNDRTTSFR